MVLSICIPGYKRIKEVRKTLQSIYTENAEVSLDKFEVVLSDNDPDGELEQLLSEFPYPNLKYFKSSCEGFMNSFFALSYGQGEFLKLHNSQTEFRSGAIKSILIDIEKSYKTKSHIFYSNGMLNKNKMLEFNDYDSFMSTLSFWSSWSNGFCIWKDEFEKIKNIELNKLFPHTSLFLAQSKTSQYLINDIPMFHVQRIPKRGGHNKFTAFSYDYPFLIDEHWKNRKIATHTKDIIFRDLMLQMFPVLVFNKYIARIETFESEGYYKNLRKFFPWYAYWLSYILAPAVIFIKLYNKISKKLFFRHRKMNK